ncbi:MAG: HAMP domain-containing sensor histidine kinase [archaeon]
MSPNVIVVLSFLIIIIGVFILFLLIRAEDKKKNHELSQIIVELMFSIKKQKIAEKAKNEFLTVTSHELKTPLTPMKSQLEMILENYFGKLSGQQKESLEMVLSNVVRLHNLINEIMDISKLESGNMKFKLEKSDIKRLVRHIAANMAGEARLKKIKLSLKIVGDIREPVFDHQRINQVLVNLVSNAIKFTPNGGKIEIVIKGEKDKVIVEVNDTGIGIKEHDLKDLFKPFKQVDSSMARNFEGSGLGLAISKGIIRRHHGTIKAVSEFGKGSSFVFTLPYNLRPENSESKIFEEENEDV